MTVKIEKSYPKITSRTPPLVFDNDVSEVLEEIDKTDIKTIGNIDAANFVWPSKSRAVVAIVRFFSCRVLAVIW